MPTKLQRGGFKFERSVGAQSDVRVAVATIGVVDRDRDLILPGALVNDTAVVSDWQHSYVFQGKAPVGSAKLMEDGDRLLARVAYDDSDEGRRSCSRVERERPDWSVGYHVLKERAPTPAESALGAKRVIEQWRVYEISPVDKGAGISTGTHTACCGSCAAKGGHCGSRRSVKQEWGGPATTERDRALALRISRILEHKERHDRAAGAELYDKIQAIRMRALPQQVLAALERTR